MTIAMLYDYVKKEIGSLHLKIDESIQALDQKIDQKIDQLDQKIDRLDQKLDMKIDQLDQKIDLKIDDLDKKFNTSLARQFAHFDKKFKEVYDRLDQTATKSDIDKIVTILDRMEANSQRHEVEIAALMSQANRHDRWIEEASPKLGIAQHYS